MIVSNNTDNTGKNNIKPNEQSKVTFQNTPKTNNTDSEKVTNQSSIGSNTQPVSQANSSVAKNNNSQSYSNPSTQQNQTISHENSSNNARPNVNENNNSDANETRQPSTQVSNNSNLNTQTKSNDESSDNNLKSSLISGENNVSQSSKIIGTQSNPQNRPETVKNSVQSYHPNGDVVYQDKSQFQQQPVIGNEFAVQVNNLATQNTQTVANRSLGVDVSGYQGTDMTPYAQDGAKFAIVKLSEGTSYYNSKAAGQIKSAEQNGMMVMGYHFARFGSSTSEADQEANHAIANAQLYGLPKGAYLACDYEQGCGAGSNVTANTAAVVEFMKKVQQAGYIPLLYSGAYYMKSELNLNTITSQFGNCLWVASYETTAPVTGPNFNYFPSINHVIIWQYSDNWHGVDGDVCVMPLTSNQSPNSASSNQPASHPSSSSSSSSNTSNEPTWTDNLGDVWHKETGIFTVGDTPLHLRWGATTSSSIITTLQPGQQVQYDAWMNDGTYTWVRQPRGNGTYGYVAVRDKSGAFGTFSDVPGSNNSGSNNNKPANNQPSNSKPANNSTSSNSDANYTGQKQVNGKWQYWQNGKPVKNTYEWIPSENKETYYDNNGNMVYGSQNINGHNQYFDPVTGAQVKNNFVTNDGKSYYYDQNGNMVYGEQHVWDANRYFDPKTGVEAKNQYVWLPDKNEEVYYGPDGAMVYGWQTIDGQKRYFDPKTGAQAKSCTLNIDGQNWSFDGQGNPTLIKSNSTGAGTTNNTTSSSANNQPATSGNKGTNNAPSTGSTGETTSSSANNQPATSGNKGTDIAPSTGSTGETTSSSANSQPATSSNKDTDSIQNSSANSNSSSASTVTTTNSSKPIVVTVHYVDSKGNVIGTKEETIAPNSTLDVSKDVPNGYEVSSQFKPQNGIQANGYRASLNVPVVSANGSTKNENKNTEESKVNNSGLPNGSSSDKKVNESTKNDISSDKLVPSQITTNNESDKLKENSSSKEDKNKSLNPEIDKRNNMPTSSQPVPQFNTVAKKSNSITAVHTSNRQAENGNLIDSSNNNRLDSSISNKQDLRDALSTISNSSIPDRSAENKSDNELPNTGIETDNLDFVAAALSIAGSALLSRSRSKEK